MTLGIKIYEAETGELIAGGNLHEQFDFSDWQSEGVKLASANKKLNWMIGDWLNAGKAYGQRAQIAAEQLFPFDYGRLRNIASVCGKFEASRRCDSLSFSHHEEVASLPIDQASDLLGAAEREHLSTRDLRRRVVAHKVAVGIVTPLPSDDPDAALISALQGAWNRASREVRAYMLPLFNECDLGTVDA